MSQVQAPVLNHIAYFSMEVALESSIPTYSGGLGVLAGDFLRAAADAGIPSIGISLLYRKGYFEQSLSAQGAQTEEPVHWIPEEHLEKLPTVTEIMVEGRRVVVGAWQYLITGASGATIPVYLLDSASAENAPYDQTLTDWLYGGDARYRLAQEAILGIGGVGILRALGYQQIKTYHMNEGHSALLGLALLEEHAETRGVETPSVEDVKFVREQCVFTTHTPVSAGHDQFPLDLAREVLGQRQVSILESTECCADVLNMTVMALRLSRYVNGVAMRHGQIARAMYPDYPIDSITNGVHADTWTSPEIRALLDRHAPAWRRDNFSIQHLATAPLESITSAHKQAKSRLIAEVSARTGATLDPDGLTIGFARRATSYKRADLLFSDPERLRRIVREHGPIQLLYGGKAHPQDEGGKTTIRDIFGASATLRDALQVIYLENYDVEMGKLLTAGTDLWLNTPLRPLEASGTSGMKAALNGVPSLSVLDGWWVEGHIEGVTGWSIGTDAVDEGVGAEAESLYDKLERVILPMFYTAHDKYAKVMRSTIVHNGSYFTAQRMVLQYARNAYRLNGVF